MTSLELALTDMEKDKVFMSFDHYIIKEMGVSVNRDNITQNDRQKAYTLFRERTKEYEFVSMPTLRRWFGLNGFSKPRREKIYEVNLVLHNSREKAQEYLMVGLGEPAFQINDYHEIIYLYGLDHHLSVETCHKMITSFELSMTPEFEIEQTHTTHQMMRMYEDNKNLSLEDFQVWMYDHIKLFKGYSKISMDYLQKYKIKIVGSVKKYSQPRLEELLAEAGYYQWKSKSHLRLKSERDLIYQFVKKGSKGALDLDLQENILELSRMVYSDLETNVMLLSEVFVENNKNTHGMSGKYLSDLFNIPLQKEKEIRVNQALSYLRTCNQHEKCPEWINRLALDLSRGKQKFSLASSAYPYFERYAKEHKRRSLLIKREDILPLVLYVAQEQYTDLQQEDYQCEKAKNIFVLMANCTLTACFMSPLSESNELDCELLACYQPDEMYSYSELLETLQQVENEQKEIVGE